LGAGVMWANLIRYCTELKPILDALNIVLWGIYVYYTIRTFKQIHRQTELQSEAFLVVTSKMENSLKEEQKEFDCVESHNIFKKWHEILKNNLPSALSGEKYLNLKLDNRGRSDIVSWKIKVSGNIDSGDYLSTKCNINGEKFSWIIEEINNKQLIPSESCIEVIIAKLGVYPEISLTWEIEYHDMRGRKYTNFGGAKSVNDKNFLAYIPSRAYNVQFKSQ
jgi:hypothetical protein